MHQSSHIEGVDRERVGLNAVSFNDGHVVIVDGDVVRRTTADVDKAKTVPLSLRDTGDRERNVQTTGISTLAVNGRSIGNARAKSIHIKQMTTGVAYGSARLGFGN